MSLTPLNGWQRLWVVTAVLWAVPVLVVAWNAWPMSAALSDKEISASLSDVPDTAIRLQLTPAENAALASSGWNELWVAKVGGNIVNPYTEPDMTPVPEPDPEWLGTGGSTTANKAPWLLSVREFAQLIKAKYPNYSTWSDDVLTANVLGKYPDYRRRVDPRAIAAASQKYEELASVQAHVATVARTLAVPVAVRAKRTRTALTAFAAWAVPLAALYSLGWSVGWVRQGFKKQQ